MVQMPNEVNLDCRLVLLLLMSPGRARLRSAKIIVRAPEPSGNKIFRRVVSLAARNMLCLLLLKMHFHAGRLGRIIARRLGLRRVAFPKARAREAKRRVRHLRRSRVVPE